MSSAKQCPRHKNLILNHIYICTLTNFMLARVLRGKYYFYVHFIDENTESKKVRSDLKWSHNYERSEAGLKSR